MAEDELVVVLLPVASVVVAFLLYAVRDRAARRRRRAARSGAVLECRALLSLGGGPVRSGRLSATPEAAVWRPRGARPPAGVDLTGARPRAAAAALAARSRRARPDDLVLDLLLSGGLTARLVLHEGDAATLVSLLDAAPAAAGAPATTFPYPPRAPRWVLACLVLATLWLAGWGWLTVLGGERVTATVIGNDSGSCQVSWVTSAGDRGSALVDCADEPVGAQRDVWATAWPLRGQASDVAWTGWGVSLVAAALFAAVGWGIRRERTATAGGSAVQRFDLPAPVPVSLEAAELNRGDESAGQLLERLAPHAAAQLPAHGWEDAGKPDGARPGRLLPRLLRALGWPAAGLALLLVLTAPWPYRAWVLHGSVTTLGTAVSTGEVAISGPGPVPDDVTVLIQLPDGRRQRADLAVLGKLPEGRRVNVQYARDRPRWARLDGAGDGLARAVALSVAGLLLVAGVAGWRLLGVRAERRAVSAALHGRSRPAAAVLTADPLGEPLLLLADQALVPARLLAVPVQPPLPAGCAALFAAGPMNGTALGRLADHEPVALRLPAFPAPLLPRGPAWAPDPDQLADLLDSAGTLRRRYGGDDSIGDQKHEEPDWRPQAP